MKNYLLILSMFFSITVLAQRVETDYGDIYYEFFQFKEAARYYEEALADPRLTKKQYLYVQLSQCYKYLFQYVKAEEYFEKLMTSGENVDPELYLDYGNILKLNGKYKEAKAQYRKYQSITGTNFADPAIRSINWAIRTQDTLKNYAVALTDLNISGQSLGYCFYGDGLIYAHARNKKPIGKDMAPLFDLDYARRMNNMEFQAELNLLSDIQFDLNEGSPCISADRQTLYFSANSTNFKRRKKKTVGTIEVSEEGVSNLKIYTAQAVDGLFQNPVELSFNNKEFSCIHPFILADGATILFSSNMPGGFGGFDLYKSILQVNGKWGEPINLGKNVNTEENELFPWVSENMLYFSSKGFNNYGGYDIYVAKLTRSLMPVDVKNFGKPINSFRDDVAFITNDGGRTGYFSTNRNNDDGNDYVYYFRETGLTQLKDDEFKADTILDTIFANVTPSEILDTKITTPVAVDATLKAPPIVQKQVPINAIVPPPIIPNTEITVNPSLKKKNPNTKKRIQPIAIADAKPKRGAVPSNGIAPLPNSVSIENKESNKNSIDDKMGVQPAADEKRLRNDQPLAKTKSKKSKLSANIDRINSIAKNNVSNSTILNTIFTPVSFAFNVSTITVPQMDAADSLVRIMKTYSDVKVLVAAYADSRGSFEYNMSLSEKRAASVKKYLVKNGIPTNRIITKGLGEMNLLNQCVDGVICSEEQHAVNRRVEMKLVK